MNTRCADGGTQPRPPPVTRLVTPNPHTARRDESDAAAGASK